MKIKILPCQGACNVGVMSKIIALRYTLIPKGLNNNLSLASKHIYRAIW